MSPALVICLRNTTDWSKMTDDKLKWPENIYIPPDRNFEQGLANWKRLTGNASYHHTRHKLKQIAWKNWSEVSNLSMIVDVTTVPCGLLAASLDSIYEDYILLPTDDDDWYAPYIYERICEYSHFDWINWRGSSYNTNFTPSFSEIVPALKKEWMHSNSYAITKSGFSKMQDCERENVIRVHHNVVYVLDDRFSEKSIDDASLSLYNSHVASISHLVTKDLDAIEKKSMPNVPQELNWSIPYISQMINVLNTLVRVNPGRTGKFL